VGSNSKIQGYNFYPMLHFRRKFSSSIMPPPTTLSPLLSVPFLLTPCCLDSSVTLPKTMFLLHHILFSTFSTFISLSSTSQLATPTLQLTTSSILLSVSPNLSPFPFLSKTISLLCHIFSPVSSIPLFFSLTR